MSAPCRTDSIRLARGCPRVIAGSHLLYHVWVVIPAGRRASGKRILDGRYSREVAAERVQELRRRDDVRWAYMDEQGHLGALPAAGGAGTEDET